jgi:demethylmenaquinone methyltransferase/2-methoxy-6-polyprenyl-1,4-benzoquinol methylase
MKTGAILDPNQHEKVKNVFGEIAHCYDRANRFLSLMRDQKWRNEGAKLLNLQPGEVALDLCCGTGKFMQALKAQVGPSGRVIGMDFSGPMLECARKLDPSFELHETDVHTLPVKSAAVNGVAIGWGLRNVSRPDDVLAECLRVLVPGGRLVILDATPSSLGGFSGWARRCTVNMVGWVTRKGESYRYLNDSIERFDTLEQLTERVARAGLTVVSNHTRMFGNIQLVCAQKPRESEIR